MEKKYVSLSYDIDLIKKINKKFNSKDKDKNNNQDNSIITKNDDVKTEENAESNKIPPTPSSNGQAIKGLECFLVEPFSAQTIKFQRKETGFNLGILDNLNGFSLYTFDYNANKLEKKLNKKESFFSFGSDSYIDFDFSSLDNKIIILSEKKFHIYSLDSNNWKLNKIFSEQDILVEEDYDVYKKISLDGSKYIHSFNSELFVKEIDVLRKKVIPYTKKSSSSNYKDIFFNNLHSAIITLDERSNIQFLNLDSDLKVLNEIMTINDLSVVEAMDFDHFLENIFIARNNGVEVYNIDYQNKKLNLSCEVDLKTGVKDLSFNIYQNYLATISYDNNLRLFKVKY